MFFLWFLCLRIFGQKLEWKRAGNVSINWLNSAGKAFVCQVVIGKSKSRKLKIMTYPVLSFSVGLVWVVYAQPLVSSLIQLALFLDVFLPLVSLPSTFSILWLYEFQLHYTVGPVKNHPKTKNSFIYRSHVPKSHSELKATHWVCLRQKKTLRVAIL